MSTVQKDLWGNLQLTSHYLTPIAILREQAALLSKRTEGLLRGEVAVRAAPPKQQAFVMNIVAPALNDYSYVLLRIIQLSVLPYPLEVFDGTPAGKTDCPDEAAFLQAVEKILSSDNTHRVIQSLVAQSRDISADSAT